MSDQPPTPDPERATLPRDGPERRVIAVAPDGLDEIERHVMASEAPAVILLDRASMRLLLRYVRALERERDEPTHPDPIVRDAAGNELTALHGRWARGGVR